MAGTVPPIIDNVVPIMETELPEQVVAALGGVAKVTPDGKVSDRAAGTADNVNGNGFGLVMVIVKTEIPPEPIVSGVKKLLTWIENEISPCAITGLAGVKFARLK